MLVPQRLESRLSSERKGLLVMLSYTVEPLSRFIRAKIPVGSLLLSRSNVSQSPCLYRFTQCREALLYLDCLYFDHRVVRCFVISYPGPMTGTMA